jgi:hypothetical protein
VEENGKVSVNQFPSFGVKCELLGCGHLSVDPLDSLVLITGLPIEHHIIVSV